MTRTFQYIGEGSKKFWEISEPTKLSDYGAHEVTVRYGRIGQWEQFRSKAFPSRVSAIRYYTQKVHEKERKGYKETTPPTKAEFKEAFQPKKVTKPVLTPPWVALGEKSAIVAPQPAPKKCDHTNLTKKGNKWSCVSCKSEMDFGSTLGQITAIEEEKTVRRFINLKWREA